MQQGGGFGLGNVGSRSQFPLNLPSTMGSFFDYGSCVAQFLLNAVEKVSKFSEISFDRSEDLPHFARAFLNRERGEAHLQAVKESCNAICV